MKPSNCTKTMKIKADRHWQTFAEEHGYESELKMWKQLHAKQQKTINEIAQELNLTYRVAQYRMNKCKFKIKRRGTISKDTIRKIQNLRLKKHKQSTVSKELGISSTSVTKYQLSRSVGAYGNK